MNDDRDRMARAVARVRAAHQRVRFLKDTCGCKTPLHTMRCGVGGRVVVTGRAWVSAEVVS